MRPGLFFALGLCCGALIGFATAAFCAAASLADRRPRFQPNPAFSLDEAHARYAHPTSYSGRDQVRHYLAPGHVAPVLELDAWRKN
jgi:hypothetical protein